MAKVKIKDPAAEPPVDGWTVGFGIVCLVVAVVWVSMHVGTAMSMVNQNVPMNPIDMAAKLFRGKLIWPRGATVVALLMLGTLAGLVFVYRKFLRGRGDKGKLPIDAKGDNMATGGQIEALTADFVRKKAHDLGVRIGPNDPPGVIIGESVADGVPLYGSYEDLHLDIWGPRQGKSTSRVIPAILDAVGPVIVTSNKRDVVDATVDIREAKHHPTFIFDPQHVATPHDREPTWHWNPMAWVRGAAGDLAGAEVRAAKLAGHFADSDDGIDAKADPFFDPEAEDLLAGLFLAAALGNYPITMVWEWITHSQDNYPVEVLKQAVKEGYRPADGLAAQYNTEGRTKSGIFGTAKKMARCLKLTAVQNWVVPSGGQELDELDFLERGGTLYCLSLEGRGSAAPLVSALTEAVIDVAMRKASQSRGGRLEVPLLAVLDEAANVVRWKDLPKQYSHFGSRGLVVMTVLQSWAQGARCWGVDGMEALWAAANVRVIGSGIDDADFLRERAEVIGDSDSISRSVSKSGGGKSVSSSLSSGRTFSVSDLVSLPRGRVILFPSGGKAVLVKTLPWWDGPYADQVRRSIERHDPGRQTTINDLVEQRQTPAYESVDYTREEPAL